MFNQLASLLATQGQAEPVLLVAATHSSIHRDGPSGGTQMLIYNLGEPGCLPWHVLNVMCVERCVCKLGHLTVRGAADGGIWWHARCTQYRWGDPHTCA